MSDPLASPDAAGLAGAADDSVTIAIARDPSLVRTVRLVAAAVARRAAVHEATIEEIRLAVGEACAVMIGIDEVDAAEGPDGTGAADPTDQVVVRLSLGVGVDASIEGRVGDLSGGLAGLDINPWALLQGLSDEVRVQDGDGRTTVSMSWPLSVTGL